MTSQQGSTGSRTGSEIGKEHRGEIAECCLWVLRIVDFGRDNDSSGRD